VTGGWRGEPFDLANIEGAHNVGRNLAEGYAALLRILIATADLTAEGSLNIQDMFGETTSHLYSICCPRMDPVIPAQVSYRPINRMFRIDAPT
jgi:hypothetical protein